MLLTWREVDDHVSPMRSRFLLADRTKTKSNGKLVNSTPADAVEIAIAGMMGGITSPSRPWIRTKPANAAIADDGEVREWSHEVSDILLDIAARSNLYDVLPEIYGDLLAFGTAAMFVEEDAEKVIRAYHLPIGQYALRNSARLEVDTVFRELSMTVTQLVDKFGMDNLSVTAKSLLETKSYDKTIDVLHVVEPNKDYYPNSFTQKPYRSIWLEQSGDDQTILGMGGYDEFPLMCPRWRVVGEDVYGVSPGMKCLGDCKALRTYEIDKAAYVDRTVAPPMVVPASLANKRVTLLPGDKIVLGAGEAGQTVYPAITLNPAGIGNVREVIADHTERIGAAFFVPLWQTFTGDERSGITATEIAAKQQEKLLLLGPVMQRIENELLDPWVARVYAIAWRRGLIPEPPSALKVTNPHGQWVGTQPIRVEYISVATQAQKAIGIIALERFAQVQIGNATASGRLDMLDNIDFDKFVKHHADATGVPPDLLLDDEKVQALRASRAQAQQQAQQAANAQQTADTAKSLAQAPTSSDNALGALLSSYNTPNTLGAG